MAELFRYTDRDGYALSAYVDDGESGIFIDTWPEHAEHRLVCVELPDAEGRRLHAALGQHYAEEVTE